jgi:4-amino-4-deoxy-L-arabinose transferase-like glycosyltransferase
MSGPMNVKSWPLILLGALLTVRAAVAMALPLSADEAYYWLWSRHLDFGYFDHPPAIAWAIKCGTLLFGDTTLGIRAMGFVLSVAASWLVFESGLAILKDRGRAWAAVLLFNLTLMINAELLAATPDQPSIAAAALFLFCLARLQQTGNGRWWLAVGAAGGLGMLSKYSAGFLGLGTLAWLIADPKARRWLATPWPWAGGVLALVIFLPNLLWQAAHQWETFVFQFGRIGGHQLTGRYLIEFFGAQLGLASPLIFVLGVAGLARARRGDDRFLLAMLMAPAIVYFLIHALHDRVQGNWPCFLFPAFAILAADAMERDPEKWLPVFRKSARPSNNLEPNPDLAPGESPGWRKWSTRLAMPLAGAMLLLVYVQVLTGVVPLGRNDPLAHLLGRGFRPVADSLPGAARAAGAGAVVTTDYETTAWLRFYEPGLKVIQADETYRYPNAPSPPSGLLSAPLLYVVEQKRDRHAFLAQYFSAVEPVTVLQVSGKGGELSRYTLYVVSGSKALVPSKMP